MFHDPGSLWLGLVNLFSFTSRQQHFNNCSHSKVAVIQLNYALAILLVDTDRKMGKYVFFSSWLGGCMITAFNSSFDVDPCDSSSPWTVLPVNHVSLCRGSTLIFFINNHSRGHTRQWQVLLAANIFPARAIFNYHMTSQWHSLSPLVTSQVRWMATVQNISLAAEMFEAPCLSQPQQHGVKKSITVSSFFFLGLHLFWKRVKERPKDGCRWGVKR